MMKTVWIKEHLSRKMLQLQVNHEEDKKNKMKLIRE